MPLLNKALLSVGMCAVIFLSAASSATAQNTRNLELSGTQPTEAPFVTTQTDDTYIVQLKDPAVAMYKGGINNLAATNPQALGTERLDTNSSASLEYTNYLKQEQQLMLDKASQAIGRQLTTKYSYQHAINGFALKLSESEAQVLRNMEGFYSIQRERMEHLTTDIGPGWINAPSIWNKRRNGSRGEGLVIAILDSGINHDHPSFAAVGGDGYSHTNPLGSGNYLPGSYCDTVDATFCNDKLIGAWDLAPADGDIPEDENGHGSHTASTAGGNVINGAEFIAPTTSVSFNISGVAPHANIIAYDVCVDRGCPGAALVAGINQVVIDAGNLPNGIAALN